MRPHFRSPRWYAVPVRAAVLTFVLALLLFAVSLMLGIAGTIAIAAMRHIHPDMRIAYRHFAFPVAVSGGAAIFVACLIMEIRHYRQSRILARIVRVSGRHAGVSSQP